MVFRTGTDPKELAIRAARLALELHRDQPELPRAVATGQCSTTIEQPSGVRLVGEVIDRAVALLVSLEVTLDANESAAGDVGFGVLTCDMTRALLDQRFQFDRAADVDGSPNVLLAEDPRPRASRKLLGKPTRCVGRQRELAALEAICAECIDRPGARAVLITGPAGAGKSRLAHELIEHLDERHEGMKVWTGYGDAMASGSALGLAAQRSCS